MDKVLELKTKLAAAIKDRDAILAKNVEAGIAAGAMSAEAKAENEAAKSKVAELEELLKAAEELRANEKAAAAARAAAGRTTIDVGDPNHTKDPARGFRGAREYFSLVKSNSSGEPRDERLKALHVRAVGEDAPDGDGNTFMLPLAMTPACLRDPGGLFAAVGSDEQQNASDPYGGFGLQRSMAPGMFQIGFEGDPTAGLTQNVPMATPIVDILARTDKNHTTSVAGGFTVGRRAEMAAFSSSRGAMEMISLKAAMLAGLAYATEEQIADSFVSVIAFIQAGFRDQFSHEILKEKLRGTGGDQYLGVLTALYSSTAASSLGPTISIAKETGQAADTFVYTNILKMRARAYNYSGAIWLANHDCYPQLAQLSIPVGVAGELVYQKSLQDDRPDRLLGRPIYYTEYASTVGDQGDLILGNWSQYLEGIYQPLQSAESIHVRFSNHERTLKFWLRNAGAPWWRTALTPFKGANTLSPFVVLDAR